MKVETSGYGLPINFSRDAEREAGELDTAENSKYDEEQINFVRQSKCPRDDHLYLAPNSVGLQLQTVALTFDDAPDATNTPRTLDALAAAGVKATFFINTNNMWNVASNTQAQVGISHAHAAGI